MKDSDDEAVEIRGQSSERRDVLARWLLGALFFLAVGMAWDTYRRSLASIDTELRNGTLNIARAARSHIDLDQLLGLQDAPDEDDTSYQEIWVKLNGMLNEVTGVKYLYTCCLKGDQAVFLVDSVAHGDADGDGVDDHANLHEVYEDPPNELLQALKTGAEIGSEPYTDKWGTFVSAFVPIRDAKGNVKAAVGVDIDANDFLEQRNAITRAFFIEGVPLCLLFMLSVVMINRHLARLSKSRGELQQLLLKVARHNKELKSLQTEAEHANQAKSSFLAMMSHEIRTPLNGIIGFLDAAQESLDPEDVKQCLSDASVSSHLLTQVINEILDFSKIEAGKMELSPIDFDLEERLQPLVALMRLQAESKGLEFRVSVDEGIPRLHGDALRISQIVNNLISNALKFTSEGYVSLDVGMRNASPDMVNLTIVVSDSGIGMSRDFLETIGTSFEQQDASMSRRFGGTGLGLAICKSLLELLEGSWKVTSSPEEGSSFALEIALPPSLQQDPLPVKESPVSDATSFEGKRALLVDDNSINLKVESRMLRQLNFTYDCAENGLEAVEKAGSEDYDVILMDIRMPILDGLEASRRLRSAGCQTPIVAVSANAYEDDVQLSLDAGMNGHLAKPLNRTKLADEFSRLEI